MNKLLCATTLATLVTAASARADVPAVVADIAPVHSLVSQVMGELGTPALILPPGTSPHGYSMRPSEAQSIQDADILFWTSASLTPWLAETIETLAPDADSVELLELSGTTELAVRESALFEAHHHDEEAHGGEEHEAEQHAGDEHEEDDHEGSDDEHSHAGEAHDPHAWLDPSNAGIWLDAIAEVLSNADPDNAETYRANAASGNQELQTLATDVRSILDPVRDRNFIVFHDAYQYFENFFDFPASGAISISDAAKPGPARLRTIQARVSDADVTCVLAEPQFNPDLVETVLDGTDAQSAALDPLGSHIDPGPGLYPQLLRELAQTLAECLQS